jgi:predicted CoA-binding protein
MGRGESGDLRVQSEMTCENPRPTRYWCRYRAHDGALEGEGMNTTRRQIDDFLALRRIAFVGVSLNPQAFSRSLWHEFERRGYEVVPVNPKASELEGRRCYARVQEIDPPVEGALTITPPRATDRVVRDCAEAGIRHVWMYRGTGVGSVSPAAVEFCEANGMDVVAGFCPYMFLPNTPFFHGLHGFAKKLTGSYPK